MLCWWRYQFSYLRISNLYNLSNNSIIFISLLKSRFRCTNVGQLLEDIRQLFSSFLGKNPLEGNHNNNRPGG